MKKALLAAGLITATAGLLAVKLYSPGSIRLPESIVAMTPWGTKPAPLKREFPSHANDAKPEAVAAGSASGGVGEAPAAGAERQGEVAPPGGAVAPSAAQSAAGGLAVGRTEDVDSRIARAQELSKMLLAESPKPTSPSTPGPSSKPVATGIAAYAGEWTGEFLGPDAGTVSVTIEPDGTAHGQGLSTMTSISFGLVGKVQSNGRVELTKSAAGITATGAVFSGSMSHSGEAKGTWYIPTYDLSGTWQLRAKHAQ